MFNGPTLACTFFKEECMYVFETLFSNTPRYGKIDVFMYEGNKESRM